MIHYIHKLLRHDAFDDSVLGNLIDNETINLLQFIFNPTETARRHPIISYWTVDWDVAAIVEAFEELYPLQAEHRHLDFESRWQQVIDRSISRVRIQSDDMDQVRRDTIVEWNGGSTSIGPIPRNMNIRVLKSLSQSFTHRDNPFGNRNHNIAFQRDLDDFLETDGEYRDGPTLLRLCYLGAELIYRWEKLESQSRRNPDQTKGSNPDQTRAGIRSRTHRVHMRVPTVKDVIAADIRVKNADTVH